MLELGGLASWQTPRIQARGDLMMLAGTCRSKIGAARSDALVQEFGQSDDPRVRDYYSKSFDEGLADFDDHFDIGGLQQGDCFIPRESEISRCRRRR